MKKYDSVVVGSGVSGLTLSLLLGLNGYSVLLLEKNPFLGGSLARFTKEGIPFDTGVPFHGWVFSRNGILCDMLSSLGIRDQIQPVFMDHDRANQLIFETENSPIELPNGFDATIKKLTSYFPGEANTIETFFRRMRKVCEGTVATDLWKTTLPQGRVDEDFVSLEAVLSELTDNAWLKGVLSAFCMCYGVRPCDISFANHCRVTYGLHESVARVKGGGDAFVRAFKEALSKINVEIRRNTHIVECHGVKDKKIESFILNTGEEIQTDFCIFTIHPQEILKLLPKQNLSKGFQDRVNEFESSSGFFTLFGLLKPDLPDDKTNETIVSTYPTTDLNQLLDPGYNGDQALVVLKCRETIKGEECGVVSAFEPSFFEQVSKWKDSSVGDRGVEYQEYKTSHAEEILKKVARIYSQDEKKVRVIDSASILTFRDYLHSPDGSAYGIKQKIGQLSLLGKLPLRNVYAAGQSSVLPGIVGAMMSGFLVSRSIMGQEKYAEFLGKKLCR